jgi:hypothetical protein
LRSTQANSSRDYSISKKIARLNGFGGMDKVVECLLCKYEALNSNSSPTHKKKKLQLDQFDNIK